MAGVTAVKWLDWRQLHSRVTRPCKNMGEGEAWERTNEKRM